MPSSTEIQKRKRKGSKHDKTGCLTCRYRRKKCLDNSFPVCGACSRLNLKCIRQPTKELVPENYTEKNKESRNVTPATSLPKLEPSPIASGPNSPQRRNAMRYYISVVAGHLSVSQEFNSFLTAFIPMATESPALFDVLLALATGHLSLTDETHKVAALEARSAAIRSLTTSINNSTGQLASHETNAAACLAFVIYEAGVGDCSAWYTHLKGTQNIIKSTLAYSYGKQRQGPEAFKHSTEGQWILRDFAYHDIIGSITTCKPPLLTGEYLDGITDVIDSCLGVGTKLLRILGHISHLDMETPLQSDAIKESTAAGQQEFNNTCIGLEQQLINWQCPADTSPGLCALAYAYRNATLIVLYRLIRKRLSTSGYATSDLERQGPSQTDTLCGINRKIQAQVSDGLQHICEIPLGTAPESALLFPVFLIGGEALEKTHIDTVRARLQFMARKRQFRNLSLAQEVLEDLWELREAPQGAGADWTQILNASRKDLLLT